MLRQVSEIVKGRKKIYWKLKNTNGIRPFYSRANLNFFSCAFDSDRIYKQSAAKGVVIKNLNKHLLISDCIRVTAGTREEKDAFLTALKSVIS